jgi:putative membrane protein
MILAFTLGIFFGVVAGLVPGVHINLIASLVLAGSTVLLDIFEPLDFAIFVVAMGVTHAFLELVPSIFLGAPDDSSALVMLPGHRMLHDGLGYDAVRFAVIGAFGCLAGTLVLMHVLFWAFPVISRLLRPVLGWLLLTLVVVLIAKEGKDWWKALLVFTATGVLGFVVLNKLELEQPLLPLLSGLFGASSLMLALFERTTIPVQLEKYARLNGSEGAKGILGGLLGGTLVTLFPGLGPGQAGALFTLAFKSTSRSYLVLIGGLHTADFLSSLVTLVTLGKARNGALAVLNEILTLAPHDLWLLGSIALAAGLLAAVLALLSAKCFAVLVEHVNYPLLSGAVLLFLVVFVTLLSGWQGLAVFAVSALLGMLAPRLKVSRAHAMGCLLVPTMTWYLW